MLRARGTLSGGFCAVVVLTKAWFSITVPSTNAGSTTTSKTIVATLTAADDGSPGKYPEVVSDGALIGIPATSGSTPGVTSETTTPLSVVLPAT